MGNAGSNSATMQRSERHKSSDLSTPSSPANFRDSSSNVVVATGVGGNVVAGSCVSGGVGTGVQAFSFDKKQVTTVLQQGGGGSSQEDEEQPYYTKQVGSAAAAAAAAATTTTTNVAATADPEFSTPAPRKRSSTVSEGTTLHSSTSEMSTRDDNENVKDKNDEVISGQKSLAADEDSESKTTALPTVLRWDGGGKNVMISGTFSKWKPIPMVRSHGNFVTIIDLPEGDHQYKFYVDGEWKHDPKQKSVENEKGDKHNFVSVRESDFEVFQALAKDSENVPNYAEKEYSQEVPAAKPWEKVSGPPVLPPHLLQVILNKDTPLSCEPTLLPEPNHVMLNHLYALSIKDGVMVLSATHRYRKKYVTTLLYKPI